MHLDVTPLAISLGLSRNFPNDYEMLAHGIVMYDALYAWRCHAQGEKRKWANPPMPKPAPAWLGQHCH